ncbi:hypothetical protein, partial [uncultured Cardiobacterium sp.]|uniref:hypothetical protein n=1 Tax=uncultured Cardiobacterium sp. TaxID=417619 RepID=UPI002634AB0D
QRMHIIGRLWTDKKHKFQQKSDEIYTVLTFVDGVDLGAGTDPQRAGSGWAFPRAKRPHSA